MASAVSGRPVFGTLGPAGSNHDFVARRYMAAHSLEASALRLFADFPAAFVALAAGAVDHVVQVAAHPSVAASVGGNLGRAHLIDAFLAPSQAMAVLTRLDCRRPRTLGLMPATASYVDASLWEPTVEAPSTVDVWAGLEAGQYDSGLTLRRFADANPNRYRIDAEIGAVTDAWLVYGREPLPAPEATIRPDGPAAAFFRTSG